MKRVPGVKEKDVLGFVKEAALKEVAKPKKPEAKSKAEPEKKSCPITRAQFLADAKPILAKVGESQAVLAPKEFSTGSFGWHASEKQVLEIGGVPVKVQVSILLTVVNSKEAVDG